MKRMALVIMLSGAMFGYSLVWGQEYGAVLDSTEQQAMAETFQHALEYNRTNEASAWVNPDTERTGSVVPVGTYQTSVGQYCREFITTIFIGGQEELAYGTACRQPDGTWMIVSDEATQISPQVVEKVIERHYVYPHAYYRWYDYYPYYYYPWYHPPRIFFSFNIVHFVGTRHVKAPHFHFHGVHKHKGVRDLRRHHPDVIVRSHRGGAISGGGRDFHGRRDLRSGSDARIVRPDRGSAPSRDFQGRRDMRPGVDERIGRPNRGSGPSRDFQGRRDMRSGVDERIGRPNRGSGPSRDFQGRRDMRSGVDEQIGRPNRGSGPSRDFQGQRDMRSGSEGRITSPGRGSGQGREFQGSRDFRNSGAEGRQFRGGQRNTGDRSQHSGRR